MNLKQIRDYFKEATGRYDLVGSDGSDNGADKYIRAGQRLLDDIQETPKTKRRWTLSVPAGMFRFRVKGCRWIDEVWFADSDDGRYQLDWMDLDELRDTYPEINNALDSSLSPPLTSVDVPSESTSLPSYYSVNVNEMAPTQIPLSVEAFKNTALFDTAVDKFDLTMGQNLEALPLIVAPHPGSAMTISVIGGFYSQPLDNDHAISFWSLRYPHLLVTAAAYHLEITYRNSSGADSYYNELQRGLRGVNFSVIEEELNGKEMELRG